MLKHILSMLTIHPHVSLKCNTLFKLLTSRNIHSFWKRWCISGNQSDNQSGYFIGIFTYQLL